MKKINIFNTLRHFLNVLLLLLMLVGVNTNVWGAWSGSGSAASGSGTTWYAVTGGRLQANGDHQGPQYSSSITLPCPGAVLTFIGNTDANATYEHYITAQYSTDNSNWTDIGNRITVKSKNGNVGSGNISLPENAKYIRIKRTASKYSAYKEWRKMDLMVR